MASRVFRCCSTLMAAAKAATAEAKRQNAITGPVPVSPAMRKFLGVPEISRAEAIKKIWAHIKLHQLQALSCS